MLEAGQPTALNARVRLKAENDRLHEEVALLREEMRIKDNRMTLIVPQRRPHYAPTELARGSYGRSQVEEGDAACQRL